MPSAPALSFVLATTTILAGCTPATPTTGGRADTREEYHVQLSAEGVRPVMRAKLVSAHALLEGIALEDFEQIEANAIALHALSQDAGWRLHKTTAYELFSAQFREVLGTMMIHAREGNLDAVTLDYAEMTRTCVACHSYIRAEGLAPDISGSGPTAAVARRTAG
jgi:hypothetical protein